MGIFSFWVVFFWEHENFDHFDRGRRKKQVLVFGQGGILFDQLWLQNYFHHFEFCFHFDFQLDFGCAFRCDQQLHPHTHCLSPSKVCRSERFEWMFVDMSAGLLNGLEVTLR